MGSTGGGGDNSDKIAKNCMKITKVAFLGQNSGERLGENKPIFRMWGGAIPPVPPTRGNPAKKQNKIYKCAKNRIK